MSWLLEKGTHNPKKGKGYHLATKCKDLQKPLPLQKPSRGEAAGCEKVSVRPGLVGLRVKG